MGCPRLLPKLSGSPPHLLGLWSTAQFSLFLGNTRNQCYPGFLCLESIEPLLGKPENSPAYDCKGLKSIWLMRWSVSAALASLSSTATRFEESPPSDVQHAACPGFRQNQLITPEATQIPLQLSATPHQDSNSSDKGTRSEPIAAYVRSLRVSMD